MQKLDLATIFTLHMVLPHHRSLISIRKVIQIVPIFGPGGSATT